MKGLKLDPGWRAVCTARLNLLRWKLKPPTSALTAPSSGDSTTIADCAAGICSSSLSFAHADDVAGTQDRSRALAANGGLARVAERPFHVRNRQPDRLAVLDVSL